MVECCSTLFNDFKFEELTNADPPNEKGVYVIKVKGKSEVPPNVMIEEMKLFTSKIGWDLVEKFVMDRLKRLKNIGKCPIICVGSAGGQRGTVSVLLQYFRYFRFGITQTFF